jgi:hypothetical protein
MIQHRQFTDELMKQLGRIYAFLNHQTLLATLKKIHAKSRFGNAGHHLPTPFTYNEALR